AALGMAHSIADFNRDGLLDFIMIGMNSAVADRLASARLKRPYEVPDAGKRDALAFGNRLFFGSADGRFVQRPLSAQVARTGWSWGSSAADFNNDGFPDLYIANGHATRASTHDYESEFWLHDVYVGTSRENSVTDTYFRQKLKTAVDSGHSYGGYERNRLFLNLAGTNFVEVAHLFGLSLPEDSRNVAAQDLDRDGRLDLIVTTFEQHPIARQTVRFYRNKLDDVGQSIVITLTNQLNTGAVASLVTTENDTTHTNAFTILPGESYRTQLPPRHQLGLGSVRNPATHVSPEIFKIETHESLPILAPGSNGGPQ
ncbi:MAG TPA: VCBS repeat-containing protein, partial [Chthoniobacteraceae bacterium]|nr:VCBS repeat-containing protein [Chthoniobacteraceae bacterium]